MTTSPDPFTAGLLSRLLHQPHKIVILRASRIGDFICATPAFRALRTALPEAEISLITLPMLQACAARLSYFDKIALFPGFPGIAEQFFDARRTTRFFQAMQDEHFDLAIQMQGTGVYSNPFLLFLGAKVTAGFVRPGDSAGLLDAALPYPQQQHEVQTVLALTSFLGIPAQGEAIEFPLWPQDRLEAQALLAGAQPPFIGLHPAARDLTRRWSLARFAAVGATLQRRYGGTVVLIGEPEEYETGNTLCQRLDVPHLNLIGKTSLVVLGGVIEKLNILVTNDSGPAHIGYALHTPTVTIFGSGNPLTNGPIQAGAHRVLAYAVPCRPCGYATCPIGYTCLEGTTTEQVLAKAEEIMRRC